MQSAAVVPDVERGWEEGLDLRLAAAVLNAARLRGRPRSWRRTACLFPTGGTLALFHVCRILSENYQIV